MCWRGIHGGQGEKFEVIARIKPGALEHFDGNTGPARERHHIDGELGHRMPLLGGLRLIIEDVQKAGAQLHKVDMAGDGLLAEGERKPAGVEVGEVIRGR